MSRNYPIPELPIHSERKCQELKLYREIELCSEQEKETESQTQPTVRESETERE